jgi:fructose-1,6-bisphosphatase II
VKESPSAKEKKMADTKPTRNLALDLVAADGSAVDAMRMMLNTIDMDGVVVIGEGEKDEAPMLFNGERLGTGNGPALDIAVDPIDGTRPLALGLNNSISVVALAPRGAMYDPGPFVYMDKIAVGPEAKDMIDIQAPVKDNLKRVAHARGKHINDLTVVILDRPRHAKLINEVRAAGARIRLIPDGDVAGALMTAWEASHIDILLGVGGSPEGVLAACALRCMGGNIQGKLFARNDDELERAKKMGLDINKILTMDDLANAEDIFFAATGITNGDLLRGVDYTAESASTESLVMRSLTGTVRLITAQHRLDKLQKISRIDYA